MSSTTNSKKEVVDFLWEWANMKGEWAKLLVDKVVSTESALSDTDRNEVFNYFIDSFQKHKRLPSLHLSKPSYSQASRSVKINSLSNISGVNRLAKGQKMDFSDNITVVYGENGTGKTGYSRILKSLGFSYDRQGTIYGNVFGSPEPQNAQIDYTVNGIAETLTWPVPAGNDALSSVSVFNNSCVQLSLADRKLIVSPIGFHLFYIITTELAELTTLFNAKKALYSTEISFLDLFHEGSPQHSFVTGLSSESAESKIKELSDFHGNIEEAIDETERALEKLNEPLLIAEIQSLSLQIGDLDSLIAKLGSNESIFNLSVWKQLLEYNENIKRLENETKVGLKRIAEVNDIQFYQSIEFKQFLVSAENYINLLEGSYPEDVDVCIYCKQPLSEDARKLVSSYRNLLKEDSEHTLGEQIRGRKALIGTIEKMDLKVMLNQPSFGIDGESNPIQPQELLDFKEKLISLHSRFAKNVISEDADFDLNFSELIDFLRKRRIKIEVEIVDKKKSLSSISDQVSIVRKQLHELLDRKLLSDRQDVVKMVISNYKELKVLNSMASDFSTAAISRKTTEAREELISQSFEEKFKNELAALRKSNLNISLSFGTDRGTSKIMQKINKHALLDILSEGEQKAIALAEFLTELSLDNTSSPVVFDDPVNSLDHNMIDEVAKRLIDLGKTRQVIIFTHSILLLNSFIQQSELDTNKVAVFKFHSVKNNFDVTGILDEVEEVNSHSYYINKLTNVIKCLDKSVDEGKLAAEGYGHLRSAIEVCVEHDILKQTVKRYRKGVAFPSLLRIDGKKLEDAKSALNDIYEKCCTSIIGHSSPSELHSTPTIDALKSDFDNYKKIRASFTN